MKKILLLLLIGSISTMALFAQYDPIYDPDFDFDLQSYKSVDDNGDVTFDFEKAMIDIEVQELEVTVLVPAILDEDIIDDINFQAMLTEDPEEIILDDTALAEIRQTLLDADPEMDLTLLDSTMDVVNALINEGDTIGDIKKDETIDFASVENLLVSAVAETVKGSIITPEQEAEMQDSLILAAAGLKLLNGFAQSTANSAVTNSLFGYQDYKLFAFSFGGLGSFSVPKPGKIGQDIYNITQKDIETQAMIDELTDMGIEAGVTLQGLTFSLGLNLSWLVDRLYASIILGSTEATIKSVGDSTFKLLGQEVIIPTTYTSTLTESEDIPSMTLNMGSSIYGVKVNYQLVDGFGIPIVFRWNGLSLATGFIQTNMHTSAKIDLSSLIDLPEDSLGTVFSIDSDVSTIPLEISTGVQLISIFTVTAGAGVDLQIGSSSVKFDLPPNNSIGAKMIKGILDSILSSNDDLNFPYEGIGNVKFFNPRLSAGVGVGLGPVVLDFSMHYFLNTGMSLGANFVLRI